MQGLSEPLGALIALVVVKPFVSEEPLHFILAFVGGIMVSCIRAAALSTKLTCGSKELTIHVHRLLFVQWNCGQRHANAKRIVDLRRALQSECSSWLEHLLSGCDYTACPHA